jgi:ATP-dependent Zn protease
VLLVGPPGCGKTALARSVAMESGMPLISASAAGWQAAGHLGDLLKAMRGDFEEARRLAPAFIFLDEIDAIGNREQFGGHNKQYMVEVVNGLLEQLDGYERRDGVIVLGATNYLGNVDPALIRPGRLDRVVWIATPDVAALASIYREYLGGAAGQDVDFEELARLSDGWSGAQVEFIARCGRRRARERGDGVVVMEDLRAEVIRLLLGGTGEPPEGEAARRIAVHEAGHALVRLLGPDSGEGVAFVSILPRGRASGLSIDLPTGSGHLTRVALLGRIRVALGGRAAEEVIYGKAGISLGAGGNETSDLATATRLALVLEQSMGVGSERPLVWLPPPATPADAAKALRTDPELTARVSGLLEQEYSAAVEQIAGRRGLLDQVVELLLAELEVDGRKLRALLAE